MVAKKSVDAASGQAGAREAETKGTAKGKREVKIDQYFSVVSGNNTESKD